MCSDFTLVPSRCAGSFNDKRILGSTVYSCGPGKNRKKSSLEKWALDLYTIDFENKSTLLEVWITFGAFEKNIDRD